MGGDFFRDPPGRYLGYCQAVERWLPNDLVSSYSKIWLSRTSMVYAALDVINKTVDKRPANGVFKGLDAFFWQALASFIIPNATVDLVGRGSHILMQNLKVAKPMSVYIPVALVVLTMPVIGHQIDHGVDFVLDHTTRPLMTH